MKMRIKGMKMDMWGVRMRMKVQGHRNGPNGYVKR